MMLTCSLQPACMEAMPRQVSRVFIENIGCLYTGAEFAIFRDVSGFWKRYTVSDSP
jgi:hypothetical protein